MYCIVLYAGMGNHVALLLVFMLLLKDGLTMEIRYDPFRISSQSLPCGLKSDVDMWEKDINITYNTNDEYFYNKTVSFQTTDGMSICSRDLDHCDSYIPINSLEGCYCFRITVEGSSGSHKTYKIKIKKKAESTFSLKEMQVVISPNNFNNPYEAKEENIGTLPYMYNLVLDTDTSCMLDGLLVPLGPSSNNNQTGYNGNSAIVKCCVNNLNPLYVVRIHINGKRVADETNTPCVNTTIAYDYADVSSYKVNLEYHESSNSDCPRSDDNNLSFYIGVSAESTTTTTTTTSTTTSGAGGLVAGVIVIFVVVTAVVYYNKN